MSRKVEVVEEVTIEDANAKVETLEVNVKEESWMDKSKGFAKKALPKVGYVSAGVVVGLVIASKTDILKDLDKLKITEGISELGE